MTINLEDFVYESFMLPGIKLLDNNKILALSDPDFQEYYLKSMEVYRDKNGWWSGINSLINCWECNKEIAGPNDLRRFYGQSLHPDCFRKVYEVRKAKGRIDKGDVDYWDRVAKL